MIDVINHLAHIGAPIPVRFQRVEYIYIFHFDKIYCLTKEDLKDSLEQAYTYWVSRGGPSGGTVTVYEIGNGYFNGYIKLND